MKMPKRRSFKFSPSPKGEREECLSVGRESAGTDGPRDRRALSLLSRHFPGDADSENRRRRITDGGAYFN